MGLYVLKERGSNVVKPLVGILSHTHPNTITWASLFFSVLAAVCCYRSDLRWTLFVVPPLLFLRMGCNLLDGMVARARSMASSRGEALQEAIDRFADAFLIWGIALSIHGDLRLGMFAVTIVLISSYLGILKKAVGKKREFGGLIGKVDRLYLVMVFSLIQYFWQGKILELTAFRILLILLIIGGIVTITQRASSFRRD